MIRQLISNYPSISFDHSFSNYMTYLQFTDKQAEECISLEQLLPQFVGRPERLRSLDIGAGNGRLARAVHALYGEKTQDYSLTLLEPAANAASELRQQYKNAPSVVVVERSLQEYVGESAHKFDFVLASHVNYYFEDREFFFDTLRDLLSPGGVLCLISGSIRLLDHPFYSELMPTVLEFGKVPRSFDVDGYDSCAEELQLIGFRKGHPMKTFRSQASMTYHREQLLTALKSMDNLESCRNDSVCRSFGFLWRVSVEAVFEKRDVIGCFLNRQLTEHGKMTIPCEDQIMLLKMPH